MGQQPQECYKEVRDQKSVSFDEVIMVLWDKRGDGQNMAPVLV